METEQKPTLLRCGIAAGLALLSATAFYGTANFSKNSMSVPAAVLLAAVLFAVYLMTLSRHRLRFRPMILLGSLLFGLANLLGRSMHFAGSVRVLVSDMPHLLLSAVYLAGFSVLFFFFCGWLSEPLRTIGSDKPSHLFEKHPFFKAFAILLLTYLPWMIAFYPGCTVMDTYVQLDFYFNGACSYAPVFSSMLTGLCVQIGQKLGSDKLGLFLFFVVQLSVCLTAYACVVETIVRMRLHRALVFGTLAYYVLLPVFPAYGMIASKDPIFSGCLLLFLSRLSLLIFERGKKPRRMDLFLLFAAALGTALFRNGGIWLILAGAAVAVICLRKRFPLPAVAMIGSAALLFFLWDGVFLPSKQIPVAPKSEALSVPFQQVARCAAEFGEELSEQDRAVIDAVLDYEIIASDYEPLLSDNVKSTYRLHGNPEEEQYLSTFFRLWKSLLVRYPVTCLDALAGNSYGYYAITPPTRKLSYNENNGMCLFLQTSPYGTEHYPQWDFSMMPVFEALRSGLRRFAEGVETVPILSLFYDCAFYCWLCVALLLQRGSKRFSGIFVPILIVMLACIASPVNDCFRYFFAVAAAMPLLIALGAQTVAADE